MFSPEEIERYARHIVLHGVGGPGQQKLRAARVLVVGAGGLGSPLIQYLAAAGTGEIGGLDDDEVSLSNFQRQVLHGTADIGRAKVKARKRRSKLNRTSRSPRCPHGSQRITPAPWSAPSMSSPMARTILRSRCRVRRLLLRKASAGHRRGRRLRRRADGSAAL